MTREELDEKIDAYYEHFNDFFPTTEVMGLSFERLAYIIDDCINQNKDIYEAGYLKEFDYKDGLR